MAYLLIWGETREILAGDLAASLRAEEVRTLAALQAALDGKKAALVIADPRLLEAEQGAHRGLAAQRRLGQGGRPGRRGRRRRRRDAPPLPVRGRPAPAAGHPGAPATPAGAGHRVPGQAQRDPAAREGLQPPGRGAEPAQPDRGGALRRARHRPPPRADPAARAGRSPGRTRGASTSSSAPRRAATGTATGCASSSPRTTACPWRSRSSRSPSTRPRSRATWRSPGSR